MNIKKHLKQNLVIALQPFAEEIYNTVKDLPAKSEPLYIEFQNESLKVKLLNNTKNSIPASLNPHGTLEIYKDNFTKWSVSDCIMIIRHELTHRLQRKLGIQPNFDINLIKNDSHAPLLKALISTEVEAMVFNPVERQLISAIKVIEHRLEEVPDSVIEIIFPEGGREEFDSVRKQALSSLYEALNSI